MVKMLFLLALYVVSDMIMLQYFIGACEVKICFGVIIVYYVALVDDSKKEVISIS